MNFICKSRLVYFVVPLDIRDGMQYSWMFLETVRNFACTSCSTRLGEMSFT